MTDPAQPPKPLAPSTTDAAVARAQSERDETDESLRVERKNIDAAMADKVISAPEKVAAEVVERAREQADAVLDAAREKADEKVEAARPEVDVQAELARERLQEDRDVNAERARADAVLALEHEEQVRLQLAMLPLERETTDKNLHTERVRSDRAVAHRDDFMGMVSHDLRNSLNGILLNTSVIADNAPNSEEGRQIATRLASIRRYVGRMDRLIGDLLDVVSIDAGKLSIELRRGDLTQLMIECVDSFTQAATAKGISLTFERGGPLTADFDHGRMFQVLTNLITNALKFTPALGSIRLSGALAGEMVMFSVSDTGRGIHADRLEEVFERFWQAGERDSKNPQSVGLGLYISRCIVNAHQGKIWVQSVPGEGSTFHVTLPVHAPAPVPEPR